MREQVLELLKEVYPEVDFETETGLIERGLLDSLGILTIVGELSIEFNISIEFTDLTPENFDSLDAIVSMVERLQD